MPENIGVIIEARLTSNRLPGKHLLEILERPVLSFLIERVRAIRHIDKLILAIPDSIENYPLELFAHQNGIELFKGSEHNVMQRVLNAADHYELDIICEITGDCPLIDPQLVSAGIEYFLTHKFEYISTGRTGLPDGMGIQIFNTSTLRQSYLLASTEEHFEHVTLHINENPNLFRIYYLETKTEFIRPDLRLTLDTISDFQLIKKIIENLYPINQNFGLSDIIQLLD